jgi:SulP family sulfate permease
MTLLAVTGLAGWLAARFPLVLVRGIQASVALLLAKAAVELAERGNWAGSAPIDPTISVAVAVSGCGLLFAAGRTQVLPGSLMVLGAGVLIGVLVGGLPGGLEVGPQPVDLSVPDAGAFAAALTALVVAQIPLTFGNSVVATADAERSYFGSRAWRVSPNRLAASIAIWNGFSGITAGLPVCHGAGGVTAHYKLGARSAGATLFVGLVFCMLGIVFGGSLPTLLRVITPGALAGMLLFVAFQHALLAARLQQLSDRVLAGGIGLVTLISGNLAIGFGAGALVLLARTGFTRLVGRTPQPASA